MMVLSLAACLVYGLVVSAASTVTVLTTSGKLAGVDDGAGGEFRRR